MADARPDKNRHALVEAQLALALTADGPDSDCPDAEQISAWHEGRLGGVLAKSVEHHVAHCDSCYALWTGLLQLESLDTQAPPVEKPRGLLSGWLSGLLNTRVLAAGAIAVLAGGVLLNLVTSEAPLPAYGLSLEGGTKAVRGPRVMPETVAVFDEGNAFRLLLTPAIAAEGDVEVGVYVAKAGSIVSIAMPAAEVTAKGVVLIEGTVGANIRLPAGEAELIVVVARPAAMPAAATVLDRLQDESQLQQEQWSAWKIALRVE